MRAVASPRALLLSLLATALAVTGLVAVQAVTAAPAVAVDAQPTAYNTGVPQGIPLQVINGSVVLNRAGATYRNLDIHGRVQIAAPNITLVNSVVRGDAVRKLGSLIDCNHAGSNHNGFILRDSTLVAQYPSIYQVGILGHDFTVIGSEITNTLDAVHILGNNVSVQRSWLHDTHYIPAAQSPNHQATHNDGIQIVAGSNISITGNTIERNSNAGMMITQTTGPVSNVRFTGNWSSGGACTVNMVAAPRPTMTGMTVTTNRFRHNTGVSNCAILQNHGVSMSLGGNVWGDTGGAVALTRGQ